MPGIVALVSAISADVVAKRAAAGLPALVDGEIVIGLAKVGETSAAPRVVFTPKGSRFEPRSPPTRSSGTSTTNPLATGAAVKSYFMTSQGSGYSAAPTVTISAPDLAGGTQATASAVVSGGAIIKIVATTAGSGYLTAPTVTITDGTGTGAAATSNLDLPAQALAVMAQRALLTEWVQFDVLCWGVANPADPSNDFDAAQVLYQQVIASTHLLAAGVYRVSNGAWLDAQDSAMQIDLYGRAFAFTLELATPLTDVPLTQAPVGTQPNPTNYLVPFSGGSREQG